MSIAPDEIYSLPRVVYAQPAPRITTVLPRYNCEAGSSLSGMMPGTVGAGCDLATLIEDRTHTPKALRAPDHPQPNRSGAFWDPWPEILAQLVVSIFIVSWLVFGFL